MHRPADCSTRSWMGRVGYILLGAASLVWLAVRSGAKPSRLFYPCQRVAAANALSMLSYAGALVSSTRIYRLLRRHLPLGRTIVLGFALMLSVLLFRGEVPVSSAPIYDIPVLPAWTHPDAVSDVFAVTDVPTPTISLEGGTLPAGVSPDEALHDDGIDALLNLMAVQGTHFYKTAQHPTGIVGANDVVVLKVSNQWNCIRGTDMRRSHTNNDVVKGLIYRIVRHPEGFAGAVIVADNGQGVGAKFDCTNQNNAQDARQSYQDVADAFADQGYDVCTYTWDDIRDNIVSEYSSGDGRSGYVLVHDGTPGQDQLSYPKFEATCGSSTYQLSMRNGLWDGTTYDNARLKMINMPIAKRHSMAGATLAVKNYIGFLTRGQEGVRFGAHGIHGLSWGYGTGSDYGLLGRQLALIRQADLNVVDAIWVSPGGHAGCLSTAVRDNMLLASTDPFAVSYYVSAYILVPQIRTLEPSAADDADARHHGGEYRRLLEVNEDRARQKGLVDVINLDDNLSVEDELAQFNAYVANASAPPQVVLSLSTAPQAQAVRPGETALYTITVTANVTTGSPAAFTLGGAPADATFSFAPGLVSVPGASHLDITTSFSTAIGTYPMAVTATNDEATSRAAITLTVEPTLALSAEPSAHAALPGEVVTYALAATCSVGFASPVALTVQGAPPGAETSFAPNPLVPPGASQLSVATAASTAIGTYPMMVTGSAGGLSAEVLLDLVVVSPQASFTLDVSPRRRIAEPNKVVSYIVSVHTVDGFDQPVTIEVDGLPKDIAVDWSVNPVLPGHSSTLTLAIPSSPQFGRHSFLVVGTSGEQSSAREAELHIDYLYKSYLPLVLR